MEGTINHGNTTQVSGSCSTADDVIELKEISNISIIGVGSGALFDEIGIHIRRSSNIILQNLHVRNVKKSGSPTSNGGDAIGMESDVYNVWVDHVTIEASGGESDGYDALFDMKNTVKYVTLSYSILRNSGRGGLVGYTDGDSGNGPVTFHHNYYHNLDSRTPLLRHATAHAYNNYYNGLNESGMNPRVGGKIKAENNVFENAKNPLGTFYTDSMGYWDVSGNIWTNITWGNEGTKSHPAGPSPTSTTSINISYDYALNNADCVKDVVLASAGANKALAVSDGSSKASGSSYGNVKDGDLSTYWSPNGTTGRISVKNLSSAFNQVIITEAAGSEGTIQSWQLVNHDDGQVLGSGTTVPASIDFAEISASKLNFEILSATATPKVAEFEIYLSAANNSDDSAGSDSSTNSGSTGSSNGTTSGDNSSTGEDQNGGTSGGSDSGSTGDSGTALDTPDLVSDAVSTACAELVNDASVNWRESSLSTDQEIVECLAKSLGTPVGYGENATGGYDPQGQSKLVVITKDNPEDQILTAISSDDYQWIVFDKDDFASETEIMMYRPYCSSSALQAALGVDEATCRSPQAWCSANNVADSSCLETFFNTTLNDKDLPIRNYMIQSNTTLDGRGAHAKFVFNGFAIGADDSGAATTTVNNVIVTHNEFAGVGHTEDHNLDPDMIRSTGESHDIWIHQNTFDHTGDSAFDVKVGAYDITVSFNKLVDVKRAALHGSSDSRTINSQITTTIHNNLFVTTDGSYGLSSFNTLRRVPLLRRGTTHMFNNVFYGYRKDILSVRVGGSALLEDNLVINNVSNSKKDDLNDWVANLFDEAVKEGNLKVVDSYVYESNANCELSGNSASLDTQVGALADLASQYNSASQTALTQHQMSVGEDLRDYVLATAGKGARAPYVSTYAFAKADLMASAPAGCQ